MEQALQALEELADEEERWTAEGLRSIAREALALCRQQAAEPAEATIPEEWVQFACNVADECGDAPVPNKCAERLETKALKLLESIGAITPQSGRGAASGASAITRESDKKDAERYRWLRDNIDSDWAICEWCNDDREGTGYYRDARAAHIVDAAIDAAMGGEKAT